MSDLQAKREARRQKILGNAEKRLQKITGVELRSGDSTLEGYKSPSPQNELDIPSINEAPNGLIHNPNDISTDIITSRHINSIPELRQLFQNSTGISSGDIQTNSEHQSIFTSQKSPFADVNRNFLLVIIAFLTNTLFALFKNSEPFLVNKIFIPLLCFEFIDFFYVLKSNQPNDSITSLMLIFIKNIPPHILVTLGKYMRFFTIVFKDIMVYFFFFVCFDFIFQFLGSYFL